jgi:nitroreductase
MVHINGFPFLKYAHPPWNEAAALARARQYYESVSSRRSVRHFSTEPIPLAVVEECVKAASTAPSGAHKQPWTFCIVGDAALKRNIRAAAEKEEYESYHQRMSEEWLNDLMPLQTDWHKPFLEDAPYLVVVFKKAYDLQPDGSKRQNYYVNESVGLACGFLLAALHHAGLAALTHTPSPMNFLTHLLKRPENERPFLLIPVGLPAADALVPDLKRKNLNEVAAYYL